MYIFYFSLWLCFPTEWRNPLEDCEERRPLRPNKSTWMRTCTTMWHLEKHHAIMWIFTTSPEAWRLALPRAFPVAHYVMRACPPKGHRAAPEPTPRQRMRAPSHRLGILSSWRSPCLKLGGRSFEVSWAFTCAAHDGRKIKIQINSGTRGSLRAKWRTKCASAHVQIKWIHPFSHSRGGDIFSWWRRTL